jgi:serine protease Do
MECYKTNVIAGLCKYVEGCTSYFNERMIEECDASCQDDIQDCGDDTTCYLKVVRQFFPELKSKLEVSFLRGYSSEGTVIWTPDCRDLDIATVEVRYPYKDIEIATPGEDFSIGDEVWAVGHPYLLSFSVSKGVISGIRSWKQMLKEWAEWGGYTTYYEAFEPECDFEVIQTDAALNPGNSGGGLFMEDGKLIGINFAGLSPTFSENIGFSISIRTLKGEDRSLFTSKSQELPVISPKVGFLAAVAKQLVKQRNM